MDRIRLREIRGLLLIPLYLSAACSARASEVPAIRVGDAEIAITATGEASVVDARAVTENDLGPTSPFAGPLGSRPKLLGDPFGLRKDFLDDGYSLDVSSTQYYMGIASGGLEETFAYGGRNDYLLNVDGQKAGLWEGFFINLHGETVYGESVNTSTGAVVPVNIGRAHPSFTGDGTALTAVRFTQALSEDVLVYGGKINTIDNVQQPFIPGRGLDAGFMNAAFVFNPILGRTINYATLGAGAAILNNGQPVATLTVFDTNDATGTSGFEDLFDNGAVIYPTVTLPTHFMDMPGHQSLWGAYSSGSYGILSPESLTNYPPTPGLPPTTLVSGSWWLAYRFDQALWVDPCNAARSWGFFGDLGISGSDPNPIDWSVIAGIAGSSPIPNRDLDTFGAGYYYLGVSEGLKNFVQPILPLRDERGMEFFYTVGVTPYCHVTADLQVVTPVLDAADASLVVGLRAKVDF